MTESPSIASARAPVIGSIGATVGVIGIIIGVLTYSGLVLTFADIVIELADGKLWLKLGGDPTDDLLPDKAAITDWYRSGGNAERADYLTDRICQIIPGLAFESRFHQPCVTTWSRDRHPEIRRLDRGLVVAAAGNGAGAKCSDELGRMAATTAIGEDP